MKTIIAFAGLPGSGKTTLCRYLCDHFGVVRVDVDEFKRMVVDPNKVSQGVDPPEERWVYCKMAAERALEWFQAGVEVIVMDEVYPFQSVRTKLEELFAKHSVRVLWVEVRTPLKVAERRLATPRDGHVLSPQEAVDVLRKCGAAFEAFPPEITNYVTVDNGDGEDFNLLLADVLGCIQ